MHREVLAILCATGSHPMMLAKARAGEKRALTDFASILDGIERGNGRTTRLRFEGLG